MNDKYDLESVEMPYLSGTTLKLFVALLESPLRGALISNLFDSAGISNLRAMDFDEAPTMYPYAYEGHLAVEDGHVPRTELPESDAKAGPGFRFASTHDYARAYREGSTDPKQVAERVLAAIQDSNENDPPLRAIIAVE